LKVIKAIIIITILLVHFSIAQLDFQRPDHSAVQADEAMLTLDSGSASLSRSARGDSIQTIRLGCVEEYIRLRSVDAQSMARKSAGPT